MSEQDGLVSAYASDAERDAEVSVRPKRLADFIAQHRVRDQLDLLLKGAMGRGTPPDHILCPDRPDWASRSRWTRWCCWQTVRGDGWATSRSATG
ncbi:hypothetical protein GCM10027605_26440 [Micromonospora zhanjiangensis]